jgi:uncharacterized protein
MIIDETYNLILKRYGRDIEELFITDIRIGFYLTAVRLSDGSCGTSATIVDNGPFCIKANRDFGPFTPMKITGRRVSELFNTKKESSLLSAIRTAAVNAVSSKLISSADYKIIQNSDPYELLDFNSSKTVTIVGAFQSYIRKAETTGNKLYVLEFSENALIEEYRKYFVPAEEYKRILPVSDIVIITGQTLVNGTLDDILGAVADNAQVIVTGPTCGIIPDILFENKVTIVGGMRITDPEIMFDVVSQGGAGYHLFEYCAQKICILKGDERQA